MKVILEFMLNFLLWFFYYQTTVSCFDELPYHSFVVNSFLFCLPFIFNCISILCEKEKEYRDYYFYILASIYLVISLSFISCLSLEFILSNRTYDDLCFGIPGVCSIKTNVKEYAYYLVFFPIVNTFIHDWLFITKYIGYFLRYLLKKILR